MDEDTDTLLALLSSLIHPLTLDQEVLIDALVRCEGDVETAAKLLTSETQGRLAKRKKRQRIADLDDWLETSPTKSRSSTKCRDVLELSSKKSHIVLKEKAKGPSRTHKLGTNESLRRTDTGEGASSAVLSNLPPRSSSKVRNVTNDELLTILRPPNSSEGASKQLPLARFPPLTLSTPTLVAQHTPCTLHNSILPPELACRLFYTMMDESRTWQRNKWWLFDRVVESPHRTSFYIRHTSVSEGKDMREAAQYWYNGRQTSSPAAFPPAMEEACEIIERIVNAEMRKRKRFSLEWGGDSSEVDDTREKIIWRANVAASNCYEGTKESVGFHSDQLTYLGPYPTIASLSLGTTRTFRLREVIPVDERDRRSARTFNVPLRHNSLIIMHASTQEVFKHAVPPQATIDMFHPPFPPPASLSDDEANGNISKTSNARINITFRFYRPDFCASTTPHCRCGVPCILRPDMKNRYTDINSDQAPSTNGGTTETGKSRYPQQDVGRKGLVAKYWWTCYAGAQNDGKGCGYWKTMDVKAERRGPFVGDINNYSDSTSGPAQ